MRVEEIHSITGLTSVRLYVFKVINEFTERDGEFNMGYKYLSLRTGFTFKEVRRAVISLYHCKLIDRKEYDMFIYGKRVRTMHYKTYPTDYYKSKGIFSW